MSKFAKRISVVSGFTMLSRVLGLMRDILFFSCFGSSAVASAFILAFTLPNLFRRMLGEGTLSSAFIPVFAEDLEKQGAQSAHRILNQVLSRLALFLLCLSVVVCLFSLLIPDGWELARKWMDGAYLNAIAFPYVLLICMSAIIVGALNTHRSFFAGAFSPVILNLSMIGALVFGKWGMGLDGMELATVLCIGVVAGGIVQLAMPWLQLRWQKAWKWELDLGNSEQLSRIRSLFWIGAFGAAVAQVNILVSRFLAYSLDDQAALPYLFLSARLIELPLGVFAIAISTVLFPELARSSGSSDGRRFEEIFARGFRLTLAITLPAAIGLGMLADPILRVLFQWGRFGGEDVIQASKVLFVSVAALPFYALSAYLVKAFHARKQMKPPLVAGIFSFAVNLGLSLFLMNRYGVIGLAWANVGASCAQALILILLFKNVSPWSYFKVSPFYLLSIILSSVGMAGAIYLLEPLVMTDDSLSRSLWGLGLLIPAGVLTQCSLLFFLGFPEVRAGVGKISKSLRKLLG